LNVPKLPCVAEVVLTPQPIALMVVDAPGLKVHSPVTSQSPAVSEKLVALANTPVLSEVPLVVAVEYSPTLPALALSAAVVPTIPEVVEGVIVLVACRVVNFPAFAEVPPIAGGLARYVENPEPETAEDADNVVKAPVEAVLEPTGPGDAKVAPPRVAAFTLELQPNPVPEV